VEDTSRAPDDQTIAFFLREDHPVREMADAFEGRLETLVQERRRDLVGGPFEVMLDGELHGSEDSPLSMDDEKGALG
jgi:hypothetical protein